MWIDLMTCRLVFPKGKAKDWLASKIEPFAVVDRSAYWKGAVEAAMTDGLEIGDGAEQTVTHLLRHAGKLDVDIDTVTMRGSNLTGENTTMGLVVGALSAFAHAHAFGGRGVFFELGVQQPFSDDGDNLVHWLDDDGFHGTSLLEESALELRDRLKRFDSDAYDPAMWKAHPSGDDNEVADEDDASFGDDGA